MDCTDCYYCKYITDEYLPCSKRNLNCYDTDFQQCTEFLDSFIEETRQEVVRCVHNMYNQLYNRKIRDKLIQDVNDIFGGRYE